MSGDASSRQEKAAEAAESVIALATGTEGLKAKAEAAKALALLDLAASIRFHALLMTTKTLAVYDIEEIERIAGVND